jgi:hypothetical protein
MGKRNYEEYIQIITRAKETGLLQNYNIISVMMDIESADIKFNLRLADWIKADQFNFAHDFVGIINNIHRNNGFPATNFGYFVPRFAGKTEEAAR